MLEDILGDVARGVLRPILRFVFIDVLLHGVFEIIVQGTGYIICKPVTPSVKPDGWQAGIVGLFAWALIGFGCYRMYHGQLF